VSVLMLAHLLEVAVWAWTYAIVGAAPEGADVDGRHYISLTKPRISGPSVASAA